MDKKTVMIMVCFFLLLIAAAVITTGAFTQWFGLESTSTITTTSTPTAAEQSAAAAILNTTTAPDTTTVATTVASTAAPTAASTLVAYPNYDLTGTDVSSSQTDPTTCAALFNSSSSSTFYVVDSSGTTCWLKKNPTGFVAAQNRVAYAPASAGTPPPATSAPTPTPVTYLPTFNWDITSSGGDIGAPTANNPAACGTLCTDTAGCSYYVVDASGTQCWLKQTGNLSWTQNAQRVTYAQSGVTPPYTEKGGWDLAGTDVSQMTANPSQCSAACGANKACGFYVVDNSGTTCWLKSNPTTFSQNSNRNSFFPASFSPQATIYVDCSYKGTSTSIGVGSYSTMPNNFPNDQLSSLHIPAGYSVTLYADTNFNGKAITLTGDIPCLTAQNFNDITSSLKYQSA